MVEERYFPNTYMYMVLHQNINIILNLFEMLFIHVLAGCLPIRKEIKTYHNFQHHPYCILHLNCTFCEITDGLEDVVCLQIHCISLYGIFQKNSYFPRNEDLDMNLFANSQILHVKRKTSLAPSTQTWIERMAENNVCAALQSQVRVNPQDLFNTCCNYRRINDILPRASQKYRKTVFWHPRC